MIAKHCVRQKVEVMHFSCKVFEILHILDILFFMIQSSRSYEKFRARRYYPLVTCISTRHVNKNLRYDISESGIKHKRYLSNYATSTRRIWTVNPITDQRLEKDLKAIILKCHLRSISKWRKISIIYQTQFYSYTKQCDRRHTLLNWNRALFTLSKG